MSFEERSEFLRQSIESHDRQIGELTESIQSHDRQIRELTEGIHSHDSQISDLTSSVSQFIAESRESTKEMKLAISRLATAMHGLNEHTADHKIRIERLEEGRS